MTRAWRNGLVIAGAIIIPFAGYALGTVYLLGQICYNISGFKIKSIGSGSIVLEINIEVKNPSGINIKIEGFNIDVYINEVSVAFLQSSEERVLKAGTVSVLTLPITVRYDKFIEKVKWDQILANFLTGKTDKIFINLSGKLLGAVARIPVSTSLKISYSVAEIMKIIKEPSKPCITGKVKRIKNIV